MDLIITLFSIYILIGCISYFGVYIREKENKHILAKCSWFIIFNWVELLYVIQTLYKDFSKEAVIDLFELRYKKEGLVIWAKNTIEMIHEEQ